MIHHEVAWGKAACLGADREKWFAVGRSLEAATSRREAKETCAGCPIRVDCLLAALLEEAGIGEASRYGIRGGKSPKQRTELARERGELPRQQPAA